MAAKASTREFTDPSYYQTYHNRFSREGLPTSSDAWVSRAQAVAEILSQDAAVRDRDNKAPAAEIALLKSAGLTNVMGATEWGGGGQEWDVGYKVVREISKADGSIGQLLGYHLLWSTTADVVGTDEQAKSVKRAIIENNFFVGGAVNPRDNDLSITQDPNDPDMIVFNGFKNFSTGGVISDLTVLEGVFQGTTDHIFTLVLSDQPGIEFMHNWNNIGMRLTESGSVRISNIRVPWSDALGWGPNPDKNSKQSHAPLPHILGIPFSSLLLPTIQLIFSNMYLGIAQGSLAAAQEYSKTSTRAWPYGGGDKYHGGKATDEWYILERYGGFAAHLAAAEALADKAGEKVNKTFRDAGNYHWLASGGQGTNGFSNGHSNGNPHSPEAGRAKITPRLRGELAAFIAHVKVVTTDTGLDVTNGVFELTGARATSAKYSFDRFWRNIRTHSLHDPVAYKRIEVGRYSLLNQIPEPSWYT